MKTFIRFVTQKSRNVLHEGDHVHIRPILIYAYFEKRNIIFNIRAGKFDQALPY